MKDKEAKGAFLCPGGLKRWIRARAERSLDGSTISSIGSFVNTRKCQRSKRSSVAYGMISYGLRYIFAYRIKVTSWRWIMLRDEQLPSGYAWLEQQTPPVNSWSLLQNKEKRTWGWHALLRGKFPIYCAIYCVGMIFSMFLCIVQCSGSSAHNCPGADATSNTESSWEGVAIFENHVEDESWVTSFAKTKTMGIESFVTTHKEQKQKPTKSCDSPNVHPSKLRSETMMIRNWSMIRNPLSVICVEVGWRLVAITTLQQILNTRLEPSEWIRYIAI